MDPDHESKSIYSLTDCSNCHRSELIYLLRQRQSRLFLTWSLSANAFLLIVLLVVWLVKTSFTPENRLQSDALFGNISWKPAVIENDPKFIDSDPFEGTWGAVQNSSEAANPWNNIYFGAWVAFDDPAIGTATGQGMNMAEVAADPSSWTSTSEGFSVAVMHQLHCVGLLKHVVIQLEKNGESSKDFHHMNHCVEVIRQAIMCQGDMTLEHPDSHVLNRWSASGWGNTHMCRDWASLINVIRKHSIKYTQAGWVKNE